MNDLSKSQLNRLHGPASYVCETLNELVELHYLSFTDLWQPSETGLRSDPRFKELLRDVGLVDYYRKSGHWGDFCKPLGKDDFECH